MNPSEEDFDLPDVLLNVVDDHMRAVAEGDYWEAEHVALFRVHERMRRELLALAAWCENRHTSPTPADLRAIAGGRDSCDHCRNDPPAGHTCPRCGREAVR